MKLVSILFSLILNNPENKVIRRFFKSSGYKKFAPNIPTIVAKSLKNSSGIVLFIIFLITKRIMERNIMISIRKIINSILLKQVFVHDFHLLDLLIQTLLDPLPFPYLKAPQRLHSE